MRLHAILALSLLVACDGKDAADDPTTGTDGPTTPTTDTTPSPDPDSDGDGVPDSTDPCPQDNPDDTDGDGVCDSDDPCPLDSPDDTDADGVCDSDDPCPLDNPDDTDGDGVCDSDDPCPLDNPDDTDADGVCDSDDLCPGYPDDDIDGDGVPDDCDPCPLDSPDDTDGDGVCDSDDLCPGQDDVTCDYDGDGFTPATGDCCESVADCTAPTGVNPDAFEWIGDPTDPTYVPEDEDCDGIADNPAPTCDSGLLIDGPAADAAAAVDLCDPRFLVGSSFERADGSPATAGPWHGLLTDFGTNVFPQLGQSMLGLSTGHARDLGDPDQCGLVNYHTSCPTLGPGTPPVGFPQDVPGCFGGTNIEDDIALRVDLVAPANATGFRIRHRFYSFEFPEWVCTTYNDQFVILMDPAPVGSINGNIAFDYDDAPVSVNLDYMDVCDQATFGSYAQFCTSGCPIQPNPYCPLGDSQLAGTGFDVWDDAGATMWLETTAPVTPGQAFSLTFLIWDTGDYSYDSTALVDGFEWILDPSVVVETNPS